MSNYAVSVLSAMIGGSAKAIGAIKGIGILLFLHTKCIEWEIALSVAFYAAISAAVGLIVKISIEKLYKLIFKKKL